MKKKTQKKKVMAAFLLSLLTLSGGALALPLFEKSTIDDLAYQNIKQLQDNPMQFLKIENIELTDDFDYIKELNKEFSTDNANDAPETLEAYLEEDDYESWKKEFLRIGGTGEIISKEEFEILRQIKSKKDSYN